MERIRWPSGFLSSQAKLELMVLVRPISFPERQGAQQRFERQDWYPKGVKVLRWIEWDAEWKAWDEIGVGYNDVVSFLGLTGNSQ